MARKRKRASKVGNAASITRQGRVWSEPIVEELQAYLDSGVAFLDPETKAEVERKYEDIDREISEHLNSVYEQGDHSPGPLPRVSPTQVRERLRQLWASHGLEEFQDSDWKVIYRHGSACLMTSEDVEQADKLARRSGAIKIKWVEKYLRSPRKTRAGSNFSREFNPSSSRTFATPSPSVAHRRLRGPKVATRHPLRQKRMGSDNENDSESSSMRSQESVAPEIKVENSGIETMLTAVADTPSERTLSPRDSRLSTSTEPEVYGTPSARLTSFSDCDGNGDETKVDTKTSMGLLERVCRLEDELKTLRDDSALEIDFWKAKCRTVDGDNAELSRANNALVVKIGALINTGDQLTVNDFLKSQAMIDDLVGQIHSQRRAQSLRRRMGVNVEKQPIPNISKLMQDISVHMQDALKWGKCLPLLVLPDVPQGHPLRALVDQAFGFDWDNTQASNFLEQFWRCSDMQQCSVLALSGVALAQWVFKRSQADLVFDRYQESSSRGSTNRYRHVLGIVAMEDPEFARAIDLEVHTEITREASFEHFRQRKARALALKLQEALAPLWKGQGDHDGGIDNDQDITEQLTTVFDKAIDLQCRLVLTGRQYECIWYPAGEPFDETIMNPYKIEGTISADMPAISLTLLPGISQVVDSRIGAEFGGFVDSRPWPEGRAICLAQPLVWRGCAELH